MKILFLGAGPTMIAKNLLPIARKIAKNKRSAQFIFVSINILSHADKEKENESIGQLIELTNSKYYVLKSFRPTIIYRFLREQQPGAVVFGAFRIYDMLWTLIAKSIGVRVYNFQHGFEVDSVYYKPHIIVIKLIKSLRILTAMYYLSKLMNKDILLMCSQYIKYFFKGKKLYDSYFNNVTLHPDHIFIYSDYYREFWYNKFGIDPLSTTVIGPPDLMAVSEIKRKPKINGCCYLTQTLVEDGRMTRGDFTSMINNYKKMAKRIKIFIIKLHPRGNKELYKEISKLENVELVQEFPNCEYYLTHYSSTAFVAYYISPKIIIHELEGHPIPGIFLKSGFKIVKSISEIPESFNNVFDYTTEQKKFIDCISPVPSDNPYNIVAKVMVNINIQ